MSAIRGLYVRSDAFAAAPDDTLPRLVEAMGLNVLILYGPVALPQRVRALNPFPDAVASRQAPGVRLTDQDTDLRTCIDRARRHGVQPWLLLSSWWDNAQHAPDLVAQDAWGRSLLQAPVQRYSTEQAMGLPFCPSNPRVREWFTLLYRTAAEQYDIDALDLTHARFPHPAFVDALWSCGCQYCVQKGAELGYDVPALSRTVRQFVDGIATWDHRQIGVLQADPLAPLDALEIPGVSPDLQAWFRFRADLIMGELARLKVAVTEAAARPISFVVDAHVPTFAALTGHRYHDWAQISDAISPLLSHLGSHYLDNFASLSAWLRARIGGLDEATALQFVYRIFGYQQFGLPTSIPALGVQERTGVPPTDEESAQLPQLEEIVLHEVRQAKAMAPAGLPSYPVIMGETWPAPTVHRIAQEVIALGHDGVIFQGTAAFTGSEQGLW